MPDGDVQETTVDETNTGTEDDGTESDGPTNQNTNDDGLPDDTDELKQYVAKLRKENASRRVKLRELEKTLKETQDNASSKKTDLEKLQEQVAQLAAENTRFKQLEAAKGIAKEFSLPIDLVDFVVADGEDEMRDRAEKLAAQIAKNRPKATPDAMGAGKRGSATKKANEWWDTFLNGG